MKTNVSTLRAHHFIIGSLGEDSTVVDLGANRGHFSHELVAVCDCRCMAIEAVPDLCDSIAEHPRIQKFNLAICAKNGPVRFHVSVQEESGSMSSLPPEIVRDTIEVEGVTLEKFLDANKIDIVDLLKVDIEGAEIDLLKSIDEKTLKRIRQISVEFHDFLPYFEQHEDIEYIKKRLDDVGFECIKYSINSHADVLFINRDHPDVSSFDLVILKWFDRYFRAVKRKLFRRAF